MLIGKSNRNRKLPGEEKDCNFTILTPLEGFEGRQRRRRPGRSTCPELFDSTRTRRPVAVAAVRLLPPEIPDKKPPTKRGSDAKELSDSNWGVRSNKWSSV